MCLMTVKSLLVLQQSSCWVDHLYGSTVNLFGCLGCSNLGPDSGLSEDEVVKVREVWWDIAVENVDSQRSDGSSGQDWNHWWSQMSHNFRTY